MYQTPLYPRIIVSESRHKKLAKEAAKENVSMEQLSEAKFKLADRVLRGLKKNSK